MYQLQPIPDQQATLKNNVTVTPLATLKDLWGGTSHIIEDDHCYVLIQLVNSGPDKTLYGKCVTSTHWYTEALSALKTLPLQK